MITEIIMPKMSNTMTEGRIMKWFKTENDHVEAGETIVEIMTDKVNREVEATESGYLRKIIHEASDKYIKIGDAIGLMSDTADEPIPGKYSGSDNKKAVNDKNGKIKITPKAKKLAEELGIDISLIPSEGEVIKEKDVLSIKEKGESIKITPLAKKVAQKNNVSLDCITGTGINGKVVKEDVDIFLSKKGKDPEKIETEFEIEPISGIRSIIAERMSKSKFTAPHVYFFKEVNMEKCIKLREVLNSGLAADGFKISMTALIAYVVIKSLKKYPDLNICIDKDAIKKYSNVNISIAVDTERGLVVPVIGKSDRLSLSDLSIQINEMIQKARDNKLEPEEMNGGTFTISNLGSYDSDSFTAIINAPQGAILAVSSVKKKPVVINDEICIRPMMNITLTVDHRVIDGALATKFINQIRDFLQEPELLLL